MNMNFTSESLETAEGLLKEAYDYLDKCQKNYNTAKSNLPYALSKIMNDMSISDTERSLILKSKKARDEAEEIEGRVKAIIEQNGGENITGTTLDMGELTYTVVDVNDQKLKDAYQATQAGIEYSNNGTVIFRQKRKDWSSNLFGKSTIADGGCGICSFATALSTQLNGIIRPDQLTTELDEYAKLNGFEVENTYHNGGGLIWEQTTSLAQDLTDMFNVTIVESKGSVTAFNEEKLKQALDSGGTVVMSMKDKGHILCITGYEVEKNGTIRFYVNDSDGVYPKTAVKFDGNLRSKKAFIIYNNNKFQMEDGKVNGYDISKLFVNGATRIVQNGLAIYTSHNSYETSRDPKNTYNASEVIDDNRRIALRKANIDENGQYILLDSHNSNSGVMFASDIGIDKVEAPESETLDTNAEKPKLEPSATFSGLNGAKKNEVELTVTNVKEGLNLRTEAGTNSETLKYYPNDTKLTLASSKAITINGIEWVKVRDSDGNIGYVSSKYLNVTKKEPEIETTEVKEPEKEKETPSLDTKPETKEPEIETLDVPKEENKDSKTKSNNITAAVNDVTTRLNFRSEPSKSGKITGKLLNGDKLTILSDEPIEKDGLKWYKVKDSNGNVGYVAANYVKVDKKKNDSANTSSISKSSKESSGLSGTGTEATVNVGSRLNFRSDPDKSSEVIGKFSNGDKITLVSKEAIEKNGLKWYKVQDNNGNVGYVSADYVNIK